MDYSLTRPCAECPFRRGTPMRLRPGRIDEITASILDVGAEFPCHKTITYQDDDDDGSYEAKQHCAGAVLFALKHETMPQVMRIACRLAMVEVEQFTEFDSVFDSIEEMKTAISLQ
jgi:hypothetical protein